MAIDRYEASRPLNIPDALNVAVCGPDKSVIRSIQRGMGQKYGLNVVHQEKAEDIVRSPNIDIVVVTSQNPSPASLYMVDMLVSGKSVVTSNTGATAENLAELYLASAYRNQYLGTEATIGGGLGERRVLTYLSRLGGVKSLSAVYGPINGVFAQMDRFVSRRKEWNFKDSMNSQIQDRLLQRSNRLETAGTRGAWELAIMASHAFGGIVKPEVILTERMTEVGPHDFVAAKQHLYSPTHPGYTIKHLSQAVPHPEGGLAFSVEPVMMRRDHPLSGVDPRTGVINQEALRGDSLVILDFHGSNSRLLLDGENFDSLSTTRALENDLARAAVHIRRLRRGGVGLRVPFFDREIEAADPKTRVVSGAIRTLFAEYPGAFFNLYREPFLQTGISFRNSVTIDGVSVETADGIYSVDITSATQVTRQKAEQAIAVMEIDRHPGSRTTLGAPLFLPEVNYP